MDNYQTIVRDHAWNLMTPMQAYRESPVIIDRAEGVWLYDTAGRKLLDANASMWTNVHGHNHPELNNTLIQQLQKMAHTTSVARNNTTALAFIQRLSELTPAGLARVFLLNNGSNAIECALKASFQYWQMAGQPQKRLIVSLEEGYHGLSFGALAAGDAAGMGRARFGAWLFPHLAVPAPWCQELNGAVLAEGRKENLRVLEQRLQERQNEIACLVMEGSIQATAGNGLRFLPRGYLREVAALCRRYDIHLIVDEIFVGIGRTGPLFVCQEENVCPDFLCLGKGIAAGYLPMGVMVTTNAIYDAFLGETLLHGHTYGGNALAAAVALQSLELLQARIASGEYAEQLAAFGHHCEQHFAPLPSLRQLRQRGMVCALEIVQENGQAYPLEAQAGQTIAKRLIDKGVLIRAYKDTLFVVPPLCIDEVEMNFLCNACAEAITDYTEV